MIFQSRQIRGDGIGSKQVVPTINLVVPDNFDLDSGVYAATAKFDGHGETIYKAALHYGQRPTFGKTTLSLELHIISPQLVASHGDSLEIEVIKKIRSIRKFTDPVRLQIQIARDIRAINYVISLIAA